MQPCRVLKWSDVDVLCISQTQNHNPWPFAVAICHYTLFQFASPFQLRLSLRRQCFQNHPRGHILLAPLHATICQALSVAPPGILPQ